MDTKLLMELQYSFPLDVEPFGRLAQRLGRSEKAVVSAVKRLRQRGTIKRLGAQVNYKALSDKRVAALVGAEVSKKRTVIVARRINALGVKHNFLRDHEVYNVWYTIKAPNKQELALKVKELMERCRVDNYVVLPSKRVYKMDVKYDLAQGISWSDRSLEAEKVPLIEELGVDPRLLQELESRFRVVKRPFKAAAKKYHMDEEELVDLLVELVGNRVVRDFSAVLNSRKIGFRENCMVMLNVGPGKEEETCMRLLKEYPQITHLVERYAPVNWRYPVYFMVHAKEREPLEALAEEVRGMPGVRDISKLYSIRNLKAE